MVFISALPIMRWRGKGPCPPGPGRPRLRFTFREHAGKLRDDFSPHDLAAAFDARRGERFVTEQADSVTSIRKFHIKTQTFT